MFQKTLENFSIHFNVTNGRNAFSSGDLITGHFSFDLTKESNITYVMVAVAGKAEVHWSTGGGGKKSRRRHYSAKLEFFNIRSTILQNTGGTRRLFCNRSAVVDLKSLTLCLLCCRCFPLDETSGRHSRLSVHLSASARVRVLFFLFLFCHSQKFPLEKNVNNLMTYTEARPFLRPFQKRKASSVPTIVGL